MKITICINTKINITKDLNKKYNVCNNLNIDKFMYVKPNKSVYN